MRLSELKNNNLKSGSAPLFTFKGVVMEQYHADRALYFFEEISAIPRASMHEDKIADYLVSFAKARGLWCYRDASNNVLIRKNASKGKENDATILLQAHTDMVSEKLPDTIHDFMTEGVELRKENGFLRANGTTLGADDGAGVAAMLAVLDDMQIATPPLECLFTSAEEIGLVGANQFDYTHITAKYMLNLDACEEDTVIVGCCGGMRGDVNLPVLRQARAGNAVQLTIGGLCGGHSGEDIDRGRTNALILMGKLLTELQKYTDFYLVSLQGGDKTNAIPRDCTATVLPCNGKMAEVFFSQCQSFAKGLVTAAEDKQVFVQTKTIMVQKTFSLEDTSRVLKILSMPNGVLIMRQTPPIMPQCSCNLANVRTNENALSFALSVRSSQEQDFDMIVREQTALMNEIGATVRYHSKYPGWESVAESSLVQAWQNAHVAVTGRTVEVMLIHAGLETGVITHAVKHLCAISVGCNIYDLHTPSERMELNSFRRFYRTLVKFLEKSE